MSCSRPTTLWSAASAGPTSTRAIASTSAATASSPRATRSSALASRSSATSSSRGRGCRRIYYDRKFFHYPLKPVDALLGSSARSQAIRDAASYLRAQAAADPAEERSFEDWVVNRFGRLLFEIFFKTYTEKVWGMPCTAISADWAAQRIKGLSLFSAVLARLLGRAGSADGEVIKTLIDQFQYPRLGPGQMWEAAARPGPRSQGGAVAPRPPRRRRSSTTAAACVTARRRRLAAAARRADRRPSTSSRRCRSATLIARAGPAAARARSSPRPTSLNYRDFLTVVLIVDQADALPGQLDLHPRADVRLGRVQNFKNWSPDIVPDPTRPASASNTSASRATTSGRAPTPT